ncbi:MAG: metallophosphoesterase family protein [Oscillospiraceae bacterium]|jgi:UDP-2,3-diacylglucosamine pyrophosphatase LpxH|nr:metallophosphoesterase family protein [Oscillospiraceae bacterium]
MNINHVERAYAAAARVPFDDYARFVMMSDFHRGYGGWADNFAVNQNTYFAALRYYNRNKYTYIELGDGDELWENRKFSEISAVHCHIFWLLTQFYDENRLYMLYGNHDVDKRNKPGLMDTYYNATETQAMPLFPGMPIYESLVLEHKTTHAELFLLHGHQADFFNDTLWPLSRFLVRYVWRPLQLVGVKDPASAAISNKVKLRVEKKLMHWSERERSILIAGHTHRPVFPAPGGALYFNDGSCVHPRCVTAIELVNGTLSLVKWSHMTRNDGTLYVGRDILAGPYRLRAYKVN